MNVADDKELIGYANTQDMEWQEFRPGSRREILRHNTRSGLAVETEVLKEAGAVGHDLEALFNDPDYHLAASGEITDLMQRLWR